MTSPIFRLIKKHWYAGRRVAGFVVTVCLLEARVPCEVEPWFSTMQCILHHFYPDNAFQVRVRQRPQSKHLDGHLWATHPVHLRCETSEHRRISEHSNTQTVTFNQRQCYSLLSIFWFRHKLKTNHSFHVQRFQEVFESERVWWLSVYMVFGNIHIYIYSTWYKWLR